MHHEGHSGWRIDQLQGIISTWSAFKPDVVLLLAGTNDIGQGATVATAVQRMTSLLAATVAALPASKLLVGTVLQMVNSAHPEWAPKVEAFNAQLPQLVAAVSGTVVDLFNVTGLCTPDASPLKRMCAECNSGANCTAPGVYDRVHPTAAGYALMAGAWAAMLNPMLNALG